MNPPDCFVAAFPGPARTVARAAPARRVQVAAQEVANRQTFTAPAVLAASVAARRAAQRRGKQRSTACRQSPATAVLTPRIREEKDGPTCSVWQGDKDVKAAPIPDDLLNLDTANLFDKTRTIKGEVVRSCRKGAKQVATVGPASSSMEMLEKLFLCGVDVFRLNFSHGEHDEKLDLIDKIRDIEDKYRHPIAILGDLQGPKQRCGKFEDPDGVELQLGQLFRFDMDPALGNEKRVQLPHPEILEALEPGKDQRLLLDDGKIRMKVVRKGYLLDGEEVEQEAAGATPFVECEVTVPGHLGARKGVNTPDVILNMSPITPKDKADLKFCCKHDVDWVAMSFVQKHEDMKELRALVNSEEYNQPDLKLLAKIEKPSAVDDLQKILEECDGVMVARGDLGVEMNPQDVPFVQKEIIQSAQFVGKPVIVATQMLETMITNPMPTRAECSDIANAIIDGCDAVMLSGESAVGKYPAEAVAMQRRVIESAESRVDFASVNSGRMQKQHLTDTQIATEAVLSSAATLAKDMNACGMVVFSATGESVRLLAQRRPTVPILAVCRCLEVARQVALMHGVYAIFDHEVAKFSSEASRPENFDKVRFATGVEIGCRIARELALPKSEEDWLVVVARLPLFSQGCLNASRLVQAGGPKKMDGYGSKNIPFEDDEDELGD